MNFTFKQKFHAVGQGLFYSSSLSKDNVTANIVFDCGSDKIDFINREVTAYKLEVKEIDLLILSHLHYDHVSGLDELLKDMKVKTVVLPYLNKYERILLQIENGTKSQWYSSFLNNPYNWLSENENITNIVVINGNGEQNNDNNIEEISFQDFDSDGPFSIGNKLTKPTDTKQNISEDMQFGSKVSFCKAQGYIQIANLYFKFFNYQINVTQHKKFETAIKKLGIKDTKSALDILKDATKRKNLEKAYEQIEKYDLNKTSLVAYQGFIFPKNKDHISFKVSNNCISHPMLFGMCCCDDCFADGHFHGYISKHRCRYDLHCHCICHKNCKNILGTLLLGDIKLDYKTKRKDEFFKCFKSSLKTVRLVQLSHHGANNGWNDKLTSEIPSSCVYVASHALKNKYAHPHKEVLIKLARNQRKYISVTEYDEYFLEFVVL